MAALCASGSVCAGDPFEPRAGSFRSFALTLPGDRFPAASISRDKSLQLNRPVRRSVAVKPGGGFLDAHLLPGLSRQMEKVAPLHRVIEPANPFSDHVYFETHTELAQRRTTRGARRAIKNYLLELEPFQKVTRLFEVGRDSMPGAQRRGLDGVRFGVGGAHGAPVAYVRYEMGDNSMRFSLDGHGTTRLEVNRGAWRRVWVAAEYDRRDDEYGVHCRLRF